MTDLIENEDFRGDANTKGQISPEVHVLAEVQDPGDTDWYAVELAAGREYTFNARGSADGRPYTIDNVTLTLVSAFGKAVDDNEYGGLGYDASLTYAPETSGTFYVQAAGDGSDTGSYALTMTGGAAGRADELPNTSATPATISAHSPGVDVTIDELGDKDWLKTYLSAGQDYTFNFAGARSSNPYTLDNTYLALYNRFEKELADAEYGGRGHDAALTYTPSESGIYYLEAGSREGPGTGSVSVFGGNKGPNDDYASNQTTDGVLRSGNPIQGTIDGVGDVDWFLIDMVADRGYVINLVGDHPDNPYSLEDSLLEVYNEEGQLLLDDTYGGEGYDAMLQLMPSVGGRYYIAASSHDGGTGTYELNVQGVTGPDTATLYADTVPAIMRLYLAGLGRTPDETGLTYWTEQALDGTPLTVMANGFLGSAEFADRFGSDLDNAAFIDQLYQNVLDRAADEPGYQYWNGQMEGGMSRSEVLVGFANSAENQANFAEGGYDGVWF